MLKLKGVTLIELLIVVLILGVIAAVAIPRFSTSADNAKQSSCDQNVKILNEALGRYHLDKQKYPGRLTDLTRDKNFFPEGEPSCPYDGDYKYDTKNKVIYCNHKRVK